MFLDYFSKFWYNIVISWNSNINANGHSNNKG